jgi:DNA-binding response OmpR family regulator
MSVDQPLFGFDLDHASQARRPCVLVVDDDTEYIAMMKLILRKTGFDVSGASSCQDALEKCENINPDIILLDLMMPDVDGFETFNLLRKKTNAPIIFISASSNQDHAVRSLQIGGDDYVSKPFYYPEVIARIQTAIQRSPAASTAARFQKLGLQVDPETREVSFRGNTIRLLPLEFSCLSALVEFAPRSVAYEKVTKQIWGDDTPKRKAHLKTIVFSLRRKLADELACPLQIANYRGLGYQLLIQDETIHLQSTTREG